MTSTTTSATLVAGDSVHFLKSGIVLHRRPLEPENFFAAMAPDATVVTARGMTATMTADLLNANEWLSALVDDEGAQVVKFGERAFARGPFPENVERFSPGPEREAERERLRLLAISDPDPSAQANALRKIRQRFGDPETGFTVRLAGDDGRFRGDR